MVRYVLLLATITGLAAAATTSLADVVLVQRHAATEEIHGKVVAQTDTELLVLAPDGRMHLLDSSDVIRINLDDQPLVPLSAPQLAGRLKQEFGAGYDTLVSRHYVVVYNTDRRYAQATLTMLERLHGTFTRYFRVRGFEIKPLEFPLVAVLFRTREEFEAYAATELEKVDPRVNGYYSLETNRLALHQVGSPSGAATSRLSPANVSTLAHEGVHQLAFNLGFLKRFSDPPLWAVEGLAMFFEVPSLRPGRWAGAGRVNRPRLEQFLRYVRSGRPANSLRQLIASDDAIRQLGEDVVNAYAESWALTYFLIRTQAPQYFAYLRHLGTKPYLWESSSEERLQEFEQFFGPIEEVDRRLVEYMQRLSRRRRP